MFLGFIHGMCSSFSLLYNIHCVDVLLFTHFPFYTQCISRNILVYIFYWPGRISVGFISLYLYGLYLKYLISNPLPWIPRYYPVFSSKTFLISILKFFTLNVYLYACVFFSPLGVNFCLLWGRSLILLFPWLVLIFINILSLKSWLVLGLCIVTFILCVVVLIPFC